MIASNYIKIKDGYIDARLDVFLFEKDGVTFAYSPALDLVGYGYGVDEAEKSFKVVIEDFFEFGIKRNTLEQDLAEHGWVKERKVFEIPNIWAVIARSAESDRLANTNYNKRSIPFKREFVYN